MASVATPWIDSPVFVTGLMKTGSTLLLSLFDGHPELLVYPDEPSFERLFTRAYEGPRALTRDFLFGTPNPLHFNRFVQRELLDEAGFSPRDFRSVPKLEALDGLDRGALAAKVELRGLSSGEGGFDPRAYHEALGEGLAELSAVDRRGAVVAAARALQVGAGRQGSPPERWLFKQPLPEYRASSFEWFFREFPSGSAVVLVRDPRAYVTSLLDDVERQSGGGRGLLARSAYFLRRLATLEDDYLGFAAAADRYGPERVRIVRYEDLVSETEREMRALASFLGIRFDEALLTPTKAGARVEVPTATAPGADRVYAGSLERYRRDLGLARIGLVDASVHRALESPACPYPRELSAPVAGALHVWVRGVASLATRVRPMRRPGAPR